MMVTKSRRAEVRVSAIMRPFRGLFAGLVALLAGRLLVHIVMAELPLVGRVFAAVLVSALVVASVNIGLMSFCGRIRVSIDEEWMRIRFGLRDKRFRISSGDAFSVEPSLGSLRGTGRYKRWSIVQRQSGAGTAIIFSFIDKRDADATLKALTSFQARHSATARMES